MSGDKRILSLVVGRTLGDYRSAGKQHPVGFSIVPCELCRQSMALSPEAVKRLREAEYSMALCATCAFKNAEAIKAATPTVKVETTAHGKAALDATPAKRAAFDKFVQRTGAKDDSKL